MFNRVLSTFLTAFTVSALAATSVPHLHNGQTIAFDYTDSMLNGDTWFGMGVLPTGIPAPDSIVQAGWSGPVVINIDNEDKVPATFLLSYPSFVPGLSYTVHLFQYDIETLKIVIPDVHNQTFIWVPACPASSNGGKQCLTPSYVGGVLAAKSGPGAGVPDRRLICFQVALAEPVSIPSIRPGTCTELRCRGSTSTGNNLVSLLGGV
ncbi:hypothetical protein FB45DRAFT_1008182 [Roridomyces roridus]|uniref:Uncharacterized protein n=1 Tax=Roridomyces roridus TaxID=1738132 RepID=A0AAD7BBV1_9AGAR|nr:hypothetical protein FB45DRAFT_1008182 [Roridomyces roridus]